MERAYRTIYNKLNYDLLNNDFLSRFFSFQKIHNGHIYTILLDMLDLDHLHPLVHLDVFLALPMSYIRHYILHLDSAMDQIDFSSYLIVLYANNMMMHTGGCANIHYIHTRPKISFETFSRVAVYSIHSIYEHMKDMLDLIALHDHNT
jgi:hypothetical protein